jgi:O-acetylhomoserine (thiol)-lyase
LCGGTWTLFSQTLKQFGIETRFVDPVDPENFRRATAVVVYSATNPVRARL